MAQTINVDSKPALFMPTLYYSQGDVGRTFEIVVSSSDGFTIPSGATCQMVATKPSGLGFTVAGTVSGNKVTFTSTAVMTDEWGRFPAELRITSGNTVIGTANFYMEGERNPHPDGTTDGSQETLIPELTLLVERAENAAQTATDDAIEAASATIDEVLNYLPTEVTNLKSDFNSNNLVSVKTLTTKTKILNNVGIGNVVNLTQSAQGSTDSVIASCNGGDMFIITGSGWSSERLWAFVDADNKLISISGAGETRTNYALFAPINARKIVCNFRRDTGTEYRLVAFDTSRLTIKATEENLTSSSGSYICNNDLNNLPVNSIFGFVPYDGLANVPYSDVGGDYGGVIMTLSKQGVANASMVQFIIRRDGHIFIRMYWGSYEAWHEITDVSAISALNVCLQGSGQNLTASNVTSICSGDANNLPNNRTYGVSIAYDAIANMPFYPDGVNSKYAGVLVTVGKEASRGYGDFQIFSGYASQTYARVYAGTWQQWRCLSDQKYNNALGIGDSICEGWRNNNMGFIGMLGVPYTNLGVTGATLGQASGHTQIYTEIENISYTKDIIIADGGINDYYFDVPLGTMSSHPVINDTQANALDKTTLSGGLEYLLYLMVKKMPKAQRFFLITHKTRNFPYTQNGAGYTQKDMHDRIVAICEMYNVAVIDVYKESILNSEYDTYVSPTAYSNSNTGITKQYYVDNDRIHPLWLGYQDCYMPIILAEVQKATTKI